ncbi:hypothetical protein evm_013801 [Chilo suppressalis]|nr:hypothetical protein evm_013801 [Chilo suppressalis]
MFSCRRVIGAADEGWKVYQGCLNMELLLNVASGLSREAPPREPRGCMFTSPALRASRQPRRVAPSPAPQGFALRVPSRAFGALAPFVPCANLLERTTRAGLRYHRLTVATIPTRTKKFGDSFLCRTIRKWNALPAHVFPPYNLRSFKRGVKKQHSGRQDPSNPAGRRKEIDNVMKRARQASPGSWDRKLLEVEEKDPNRWRHTGYKQMYLNGSGSVSPRRSRSPRPKRSRSPLPRRSRSPRVSRSPRRSRSRSPRREQRRSPRRTPIRRSPIVAPRRRSRSPRPRARPPPRAPVRPPSPPDPRKSSGSGSSVSSCSDESCSVCSAKNKKTAPIPPKPVKPRNGSSGNVPTNAGLRGRWERSVARGVVEAAVTEEAEGTPPPRPSTVWTWPLGRPVCRCRFRSTHFSSYFDANFDVSILDSWRRPQCGAPSVDVAPDPPTYCNAFETTETPPCVLGF